MMEEMVACVETQSQSITSAPRSPTSCVLSLELSSLSNPPSCFELRERSILDISAISKRTSAAEPSFHTTFSYVRAWTLIECVFWSVSCVRARV